MTVRYSETRTLGKPMSGEGANWIGTIVQKKPLNCTSLTCK